MHQTEKILLSETFIRDLESSHHPQRSETTPLTPTSDAAHVKDYKFLFSREPPPVPEHEVHTAGYLCPRPRLRRGERRRRSVSAILKMLPIQGAP